MDINKEYQDIENILKGHKPKEVIKDFYDTLLLNEDAGRIMEASEDIHVTVKIPMASLMEIKAAVEKENQGKIHDLPLLATEVVNNLIWQYFNADSINATDFIDLTVRDDSDIDESVNSEIYKFRIKGLTTIPQIKEQYSSIIDKDGWVTREMIQGDTTQNILKKLIFSIAKNSNIKDINLPGTNINIKTQTLLFYKKMMDNRTKFIEEVLDETTLASSGEPTSNININPIKDEEKKTSKSSLINVSYYENGKYLEDIPLDVKELDNAEEMDAEEILKLEPREEDIGKKFYRVGENIYAEDKGE